MHLIGDRYSDDPTLPRAAAALAARLPALGALHTLFLDNCALQGCGVALTALQAGLRSLYLSDCKLDAGAAAALAGRMLQLAALDEFEMSSDVGGGGGGALMAALPRSLLFLELSLSVELEEAEPATVAVLAGRLPALSALEKLRLSVDMGWAAAPLVAALPPTLRTLSLSWRGLGPVGAAALLARAPALVGLQRLDVEDYSRLSPEQVVALRAAVPPWCQVSQQPGAAHRLAGPRPYAGPPQPVQPITPGSAPSRVRTSHAGRPAHAILFLAALAPGAGRAAAHDPRRSPP